jgi:hypothetical protein
VGVQCPTCGSVGSELLTRCPGCGADLLSEPVALIDAEVRAPHSPLAARAPPRRATLLVVVAVVLATGALVVTRLPFGSSEQGGAARPATMTLRLEPLPAARNLWLVGTAAPGGPADAPLDVPLRVDLSSGRVESVPGLAGTRADGIAVSAGALVVPGRSATLIVEQPASARLRVLQAASPFDRVLAAAANDSLWGVTNCSGNTERRTDVSCGSSVREFRIDGRVLADRRVPDGWYVAAAGLDRDRLLLSSTGAAPSRLALWDPHTGVFDGEVTGLPAGDSWIVVLAASGHQVAWRRSDCGVRCLSVLSDVRTGDQQVLRGTPGFSPPTGPSARFSPDGRYLALQSRSLVAGEASPVSQITVTDTETAAAVWQYDTSAARSRDAAPRDRGPGIISSLVWDPSSRWLFFTVDSRLFAHRLGDLKTVELGYFAPVAAFIRR